jgi:UDP-4-amino-4,6-dideoxy-N-acetyl-beta-L-altrosamine N-acetyltransferase
MYLGGEGGIMTALRKITIQDTDNIIKWRNSPNVRSNFIQQELLTAEIHHQWLKEYVEQGKAVQFIIVDTDKGLDIGTTYLRDIDQKNQKAEFGIYIGEDGARKQGHATRATKLILDHAFSEINLNRVFLRVLADNHPAIKTYEKSGFVHEGLFRADVIIDGKALDVVFMSILKDDYVNRVSP